MDPALTEILNLLLESERAGEVVLGVLSAEVENDELKRLLATSREDEAAAVASLDQLIRSAGGLPTDKVGPFAARVMATASLRQRLELLIRGEEWMARHIEMALALAAAESPVHDYLSAMARRHRFAVEWGRAELIRLMSALT